MPLFALTLGGLCFPAALGATWTYDLEVAGTRGLLTQQITSSTPVKEEWEIVIRSTTHIANETIVGVERLLVSRNQVVRLSGPLGTFTPGMIIINTNGPARWEWRGRLTSNELTLFLTAQVWVENVENIVTPAGKFLTKVVAVQTNLPNSRTISRYWHANGIGWARIEAEVAGTTVTANLRSFRIPNAITSCRRKQNIL